MYFPKRFQNVNDEKSLRLIRENPLATLVTVQEGSPFISHLPLVLEESEGKLKLIGHLARANPHWKLVESGVTTVIFNGPQGYITPNWYAKHDVPTWNYAVVHIKGVFHLIHDAPGIENCLKKLTLHVEGEGPEAWKFWVPLDLQSPRLEKALVGFEIEVQTLQAKFKLGQNRSMEDRRGVYEGLKGKADDRSFELREWMMAEEPSSDCD